MPKYGVHSAPAYVVGTATSGRPVAAETALAVSIALPPPSADEAVRSAAASVAAATISTGACRRTPAKRAATGSSSSANRAVVTSSGRSIPSSASSGAELLEPPANDHAASRSRANVDERLGDARARPARRRRERDLARRVEPCDARLGERAGREIGLDRRARDERHAVAGLDGAPHRLLQAELEPHVEVAQPHALPAELVLDDLPDAGALLHEDQRLVAQLVERRRCGPRSGGPAGTARITSSREERLEANAAMAPRRADDPELELARGDALDDRVRVRDREERRARPGSARWNSQSSDRDDDRRRAGRRAEHEVARELSLADARDARRGAGPRARACAARRGRGASPASVGSTRRPERSRSCVPSRFSSARTCSETAGCVTPSRSAACEKLRRSTTAQNAASWRVSISESYP